MCLDLEIKLWDCVQKKLIQELFKIFKIIKKRCNLPFHLQTVDIIQKKIPGSHNSQDKRKF